MQSVACSEALIMFLYFYRLAGFAVLLSGATRRCIAATIRCNVFLSHPLQRIYDISFGFTQLRMTLRIFVLLARFLLSPFSVTSISRKEKCNEKAHLVQDTPGAGDYAMPFSVGSFGMVSSPSSRLHVCMDGRQL
jgi:hypothetical protein